MTKLLAAISLGSALMFAPVLAHAEDAAPAAPDTTTAAPTDTTAPAKPMAKKHVAKKHASKKPAAPAADAPKS